MENLKNLKQRNEISNHLKSSAKELKEIDSLEIIRCLILPVQKKPVQKMASPEEEELQMKSATMQKHGVEEEELQMKKSPVQKKSGSGSGMPEDVQMKMESSFGTDFSGVNIHANDNSATDMGALAYTQGNDVHFAPGQYNPQSQAGQELLGHELTHVVQQRQGRVQATTQQKGVGVNDDPALEKEADDMGRKAAEGKKTIKVNSKADNQIQLKGDYPWSGLLSRKGRAGLISFIPEIISFIRDQKVSCADVWSKNADVQDFKPGAAALELALTVLGAGIGGAFGRVAGTAIAKVAGEIATDASVDALKKLYEVGYDKLKTIITSPSNELSVNASKGLSANVSSGLKDYYIQSVKEMFNSERYSGVDTFTDNLSEMNDNELAILSYTLDETYRQITSNVAPILQQLTIGYLKLQDVLHVSKASGNEDLAKNADSLKKFYETDGKITETDSRSGQLLITGPLGGIGNYNNAKPSISNAIATDVNESTYAHLKGAKIQDLPFSVSFRFWASTPNFGLLDALTLGPSLCKVWFVKDGNGAIWVDNDQSGERDSQGYDQGREWLARYELNTDKELTTEQVRNNAPKGALKLYNSIKNTPLNSIIDLDMF